MELLANEYFKLMDVISNYDGYLLTIKGWSITVSMALIGYAYQKNNKFILLLCCVSSICFALIDAKYKQYQTNYYPRMQAIEECMVTDKKTCPALQIDDSWNRSNERNSIFSQFHNANVAIPHIVLFLLALIMFFIPKTIGVESAVNKSRIKE